jgi:hypothetical protein
MHDVIHTVTTKKGETMSIRNNVLKVKKQMLSEVDDPNREFSKIVQQKSLQAVIKGLGSPEWETYMKMFVDDENTLNDPNSLSSKQLARLMGRDATEGKPDFDATRAYLAADGACTTETIVNFGRNASLVLDQGLV